jgi:hypothetical protein
MGKNVFLSLIIAVIIVFQLFVICEPAPGKSVKLNEEEIQKIEENIDVLIKKIHASSLFSPEDVDKLVEIKTRLNSIADTNLRDPVYAELFYNAAFICKEREYKQDAIQYFSVITKNFPETVYSKRAFSELKNLGVKVEEDEEE